VRLSADHWGFLDRALGGVCQSSVDSAAADSTDGGTADPQAHACPFRRGAVRPWIENSYFPYFCGEAVFRHELPYDCSSLTCWRLRLGEEGHATLIHGSPRVASDTGALGTKDLERVVVDTRTGWYSAGPGPRQLPLVKRRSPSAITSTTMAPTTASSVIIP
jgi:IS5 family transposase